MGGKKNSVIDGISSSSKDKIVNPNLKKIQEKCYENLMDVCRGLAASLDINTNAVMNINVS